MTNRCIIAILSATALLSGCACGQRGLALETVGPPVLPRQESGTKGALMVFSAYDVIAPGPGDFDDTKWHSNYKIFSRDGKLLQVVHNHPIPADEEPAKVKLSPGTYHVVASANGYGVVTVPVVIKPNQVTTLHLEGGGSWPQESAFTRANSVRLPNGQIVGYRASGEVH